MTKESVLALLRQQGDYLSGQEMSRQLGLSRAAVWKAVQALRDDGYEIASVTNRGYKLVEHSAPLCRDEVLRALGDHPWADRVTVLDTVDSTNTMAKKLAAEGAPHGTVVVANQQTGGRGRMGRRFASPSGVGVYLTVILRPAVPPNELMHLTAISAEATVEAIAAATGLRPGIKWTNDVVIDGRKCVGILTELSIQVESGLVDYVVVGIGTNCNHGDGDFPPEVRPMAVSLKEATGQTVNRNGYAAELIRQLYRADRELLTEKAAWMARYAADCVTIGKEIQVIRGGEARPAHADGIDEDAGLLVTWPDGTKETITSGEVSVRGMYGYV